MIPCIVAIHPSLAFFLLVSSACCVLPGPLLADGFVLMRPTDVRVDRTTAVNRYQPSALRSLPDPVAAVESIHHALQGSSVLVSAESIATSSLVTLSDAASSLPAPPEEGGISYSRVSYYTILGLYLLSFPGLWSTIKRSTKAKIQTKTFVSPGENAAATASGGGGKALRQEAGEIMAYMKANNYEVVEAGKEVITFRGIVPRSLSQAFFLTFCTALALLSLALVLQIQFQDLTLFGDTKPNWFLLSLLSPYAGLYYWRSGDRIDECSVKLATDEDETVNEIYVQGSEEELDRMWRTLGWQEKGMVKVEGLLQPDQ